MVARQLVKIESRSRVTRDEFSRIYNKLNKQKSAGLLPPQIPTKKLSRTVAGNIITPKYIPIPDCLTCGVCCDLALCVPVSPEDTTSPENFWEITAGESFPEVVIEKFLRFKKKSGVCASLKGKIRESVACEIYENRPATCREFEAGSDRCHEFRRMYNLEKPLSVIELARAEAKIRKNSSIDKINFVSIVPEKIQTVQHTFKRLPDDSFSSNVESVAETKCRIYVWSNEDEPFELHSYDPAEEKWLQHQFVGLTVAEAQKLISGDKSR